MTLLGTLLRNHRSRDAHSAWNRPNLQGPETLDVTSRHIEDGRTIPLEHVGKRIGGKNVSPHLAWNTPPPQTTHLIVVIEDLDVPTPKPAVHCLAIIDLTQLESANHVPAGALSTHEPAAGIQILRSTIGRGYHGPEPIRGHGPHRYTFQVFALPREPSSTIEGTKLDRARPRVLLSSLTPPAIARGRLTGVYER